MHSRNLMAVVLWMAGALLSFSATAIAIRMLAPTFGVFAILAVRTAAGVLLLLGFSLIRGKVVALIRTRRPWLQLIRNVIHFAATYAWALGVTLLPLATVFALEFTTPAWVGLLAALILGERLTTSRLLAIGLGFVGVLVILRPGLATVQPATLIVLGAALGFGLTTIATKTLTRTDSTPTILFWMNLLQLPPNLLGAEPQFWLKLGPEHALPVVAVCLGGLFSHLCLTNAYRHGDATVVVPLDFLRVPLIAVTGWWLYGEVLDPFVFLGSGLIITGILWNLRAEARGHG